MMNMSRLLFLSVSTDTNPLCCGYKLLCLDSHTIMDSWTCLLSPSYLRRGDKSVGRWVCIIPGSEVPVEGRDDSILLSFLHILPEEEKRNMEYVSLVLLMCW